MILLSSICAGASPRHAAAVQDKENSFESAQAPASVAVLDLRVENYNSGICTIVSRSSPRGRERLVDSCSGWRMASCRDIIFVSSDEPRLARGSLIRQQPGEQDSQSGAIDLNQLILDQISSRQSNHQDLIALGFRQSECRRGEFAISFDGAFIASGASGPATPVSGSVLVRPNETEIILR